MPKKCKISDIQLPENSAKELETYLKRNFTVASSHGQAEENSRLTNVIVRKNGDEYTGPEKRIDMKTIILRALKIDLT